FRIGDEHGASRGLGLLDDQQTIATGRLQDPRDGRGSAREQPANAGFRSGEAVGPARLPGGGIHQRCDERILADINAEHRVSLQDNGRAHPHPCGSSIVSGKPGDRIPHRRWGKKRSPLREVVRSGTVDRGERLSLQYTTARLLLSISYKGRPNVAQRFSAGEASIPSISPVGTTERP